MILFTVARIEKFMLGFHSLNKRKNIWFWGDTELIFGL